MYLKSIELQGFKSFANKLKFEFRQGITGIVGPNGSGKSNVADAVRWVLGEQSARQLRSGSMQDVIFAGTETRKPQSYASVAITFDNSDRRLDVDYEELTVTRRLYRSGESEYLLNNSVVRLKDINEIFYDTGIGQEGYSIIGQGQIDRILSGKADERRELFDEAVGIVKFKKRKTAALRKLDQEHQNLLRVNDILQELTSQLGPLKKQSETARIYLDKRQLLKECDINLYMLEDEHWDAESRELLRKIEICQSNMSETKEEFDRTRSEYDEIERMIGEIDARTAALTEEIQETAVIRSGLSGQIDLLKEQINTIRAAGQQMEARQQQIAADLGERSREAAELGALAESAAKAVDEAARREALEAEKLDSLDRSIAEVTDRIERTKNDVIGMLQSRASVKGRIQRYDTMLEQMEIRRSEISGRLLKLRQDIAEEEKEAGLHAGEIGKLQDQIDRLRQSQAASEKRIGELQEELHRKSTALDEATAGYHRDGSRLESLKAMSEHYEGYGNAIRKIMEQKKRNPGIRGVVADLIDVPEKYETAIETALGGSIRNIVTDNETTAKYLIEYLKTNRLGRATFLPLTSIRPRELSGREVLREKGVIGIASELVGTEEDYDILRKHLLGRTLVIDNVDNAILIGRKYRHSHFMVTLQGESFAPGGSITGGAFRNTENLLGRKREIEELTESTAAHRKAADHLRLEIDALREERNALRDKVAEESGQEQKLLLGLNTASLTCRQSEELLRESRRECETLEKENADIDRQMAEVREKSGGISRELEDSISRELRANEEAAQLRETEESLREKRSGQASALESVRVEAEGLRREKEFRSENLARVSREMKALREESAEITGNLSGNDKEIDAKEAQILAVQQSIADAEKAIAEKTREKEELAGKKKELSESHREFFDRRDELSERMSRLDREYFHLTNQREKSEQGREERTNYMWEEYNLTPSEIRSFDLPGKRQDRQAIKKDISLIRADIRKLGNVNVNAIEDYKVISERHAFLSSQHEDLVRSEETLTGIISRLDAGMRKQFTEKIAEIRTEFDLAFRELFGGGHGTIEIDPEQDILEAGISIIAHPPGKKLQNMMQLSGGEKALTAIALLFAIQNMKPSPFCLLDEIEAALDESNVIRFAEYLHKLTENTQFIIITHRRGTMTAADRLYGITMQEKGVSTLVSVNLIEDELSK